MRTIRTLASLERPRLCDRFPVKRLGIGLGLVALAAITFALVDRVAPAPSATPEAARPEARARPAEQPASAKPATAKARKDLLSSEAQPFGLGTLLAAGGVLAAAVGVLFVLRRLLKGTRHVPDGRKLLRVRDVLAIGPKRAIYLIGLESRSLVVGLSGDQLTLLSEYSEESAHGAEPAEGSMAERVVPAASAAPPASRSEPVEAVPPPPATIDTVIGGDLTVPPVAAPGATAESTAAHAHAFPFASVAPKPKAHADQRPERVPHKFRQLLEQAASAEGSRR